MNSTKYSSKYLVVSGIAIAIILCNCIVICNAELTPPYFNLAEGRHISATATCGDGVNKPELYCKLAGANTQNDNNHLNFLIKGQVI